MGLLDKALGSMGYQKWNPAQPNISDGEPEASSQSRSWTVAQAYDQIEVVNRGVNMIVDDASGIPFRLAESPLVTPIKKGMRLKTLLKLLNHAPNPYQDASSFWRDLYMDFLIDGNMFIYHDGADFYHLPAVKVKVVSDRVTYISHYEYDGNIKYDPKDIIHVKDNSFKSLYRGTSRLTSTIGTLKLVDNMLNFQDKFFEHGAVPGLVIKSPNTLSQKIKDRLIESWMSKYNPNSGGRRPMILDGGLEVDKLTSVNFTELDFKGSLDEKEKKILKALGVPPILLDSGNNANLRPNMRLFYVETVLPIVDKVGKAIERKFGFTAQPDITNVLGMQPELNELASFHSTLVNGGVFTPNEARDALGKEPLEGADELRIPANIAGSAANPSEGGRPEEGED